MRRRRKNVGLPGRVDGAAVSAFFVLESRQHVGSGATGYREVEGERAVRGGYPS